MKTNDKVKFYSIIGNAVLIPVVILLMWLLWKKEAFDCSSCEGTQIFKHDTIWPADKLKPVVVKVPEAYKAIAKKDFIKGVLAVVPTVSVSAVSSAIPAGATASLSACDSIRIYTDSSYQANDHRIVTNDTVEGRLIGHSVWFVNLKPEIKTTITKTLKENWKVYIGLNGTYNAKYMERWGVGPSAALAIPKIGEATYYFDAKNNSHTVGLMALIRFKK